MKDGNIIKYLRNHGIRKNGDGFKVKVIHLCLSYGLLVQVPLYQKNYKSLIGIPKKKHFSLHIIHIKENCYIIIEEIFYMHTIFIM